MGLRRSTSESTSVLSSEHDSRLLTSGMKRTLVTLMHDGRHTAIVTMQKGRAPLAPFVPKPGGFGFIEKGSEGSPSSILLR